MLYTSTRNRLEFLKYRNPFPNFQGEALKKSISIRIDGDPVPLARARASFTSKKIWDSQKKIKFDWGIQIEAQFPKKKQLQGPLSLYITFYMPIPPSWPMERKQETIGQPHIFKPDTSNMIKFVEDCCNGIIFKDDCQIAVVNCKKIYDTTPRTEFTITEL